MSSRSNRSGRGLTKPGKREGMGQILIRQRDGIWREPEIAGYAAEAELQQILAEHLEPILGVTQKPSRAGSFNRQRVRPTSPSLMATDSRRSLRASWPATLRLARYRRADVRVRLASGRQECSGSSSRSVL